MAPPVQRPRGYSCGAILAWVIPKLSGTQPRCGVRVRMTGRPSELIDPRDSDERRWDRSQRRDGRVSTKSIGRQAGIMIVHTIVAARVRSPLVVWTAAIVATSRRARRKEWAGQSDGSGVETDDPMRRCDSGRWSKQSRRTVMASAGRAL